MQDQKLWTGGPWEQPAPYRAPRAKIPPIPAVPRPKRPRRRRGWLGFACALLIIAALTGSLLALDYLGMFQPASSIGWRGEVDQEEEWQQSQLIDPDMDRIQAGEGVTLSIQENRGQVLTGAQVYEKVSPSIVFIQASGSGYGSLGSGIVFTQDGYIVTNAHVISGARVVEVLFHDNTVRSAALVGYDFREDLAVLKVDAQGLTPAEFGDSGQLVVGDTAYAIGNPLQVEYRFSMTDGIISAVDRVVEVDGVPMVLIQTSAAINSGNSGGALINDRGQVVGITSIKLMSDSESVEGMGFAIPSARVKQIVDELLAGREILQSALGITVQSSSRLSSHLEVVAVDQKSDAYAKGMRPGDVILTANGRSVHSISDLDLVKGTLLVGDTIRMEVERGGETLTIDVALVDADTLEY